MLINFYFRKMNYKNRLDSENRKLYVYLFLVWESVNKESKTSIDDSLDQLLLLNIVIMVCSLIMAKLECGAFLF